MQDPGLTRCYRTRKTAPYSPDSRTLARLSLNREVPLAHHAIIFDLEMTAWEGSLGRNWAGPGEFREVVQIGAVKLDADSLEEVAWLNVLTRPIRNPVLSGYFIDLTGISNEHLDRDGVSFADGYGAFLEFCDRANRWAYGRDAEILTENISLHGLDDAFPCCEGSDIKQWLQGAGLSLDGVTSGRLAAHVGADWTGRIHNGLDDARSVAAAIRTLVDRGMNNPFSEQP